MSGNRLPVPIKISPIIVNLCNSSSLQTRSPKMTTQRLHMANRRVFREQKRQSKKMKSVCLQQPVPPTLVDQSYIWWVLTYRDMLSVVTDLMLSSSGVRNLWVSRSAALISWSEGTCHFMPRFFRSPAFPQSCSTHKRAVLGYYKD